MKLPLRVALPTIAALPLLAACSGTSPSFPEHVGSSDEAIENGQPVNLDPQWISTSFANSTVGLRINRSDISS